jgi:hypothetical protein
MAINGYFIPRVIFSLAIASSTFFRSTIGALCTLIDRMLAIAPTAPMPRQTGYSNGFGDVLGEPLSPSLLFGLRHEAGMSRRAAARHT